MTPDLMEAGALARERLRERQAQGLDRQVARARALRHREPDFTHGVALYLEDISVSFDGFKALNELSLAIDVGELRCIIGPNGAGKTTMMDVHHRQDAARRRARASSARPSTCCA